MNCRRKTQEHSGQLMVRVVCTRLYQHQERSGKLLCKNIPSNKTYFPLPRFPVVLRSPAIAGQKPFRNAPKVAPIWNLGHHNRVPPILYNSTFQDLSVVAKCSPTASLPLTVLSATLSTMLGYTMRPWIGITRCLVEEAIQRE